jgi:NAD(P)H dehydrogenase (quinone)
MTRKPRVLIIGATGQIGREVVRELSSDTKLDVVAAVRSIGRARDRELPAVLFDYDRPETFASALDGVDSIFMVTGYTVDMLRHSKALIDYARMVGVSYVVHLGACGGDDTEVAHYGWHQFVERYIQWSGISFTHLRPEIFMQNLFGYGGVPVVSAGVIRHYVGKARLSWVDGNDIAAVAAVCLRNPDVHKGKTYRLGYDAKTYYEIADIFSRIVGKPFVYEPQPPTEFLRNVLAAGAEPAYMACVYRSFADLTNGALRGADEVFDNFTSLTGKKPTMIDDFVRKHIDTFEY